MGIEINSSNLWQQPTIGQLNGFSSPGEAAEPVKAREVLRCSQCSLVQFRTVSDLCRRCAHALPPQYPVLAEEVIQAEQQHAAPSRSFEDEIANLQRGERNRRVPVGSRLKAMREERRLTQMSMATLLRIPRSYLSRIENNRLLPGPLMVADFAAALGIEISTLLPDWSGRNPVTPPTMETPETALLRICSGLPLQCQAAVVLRAKRMLGITPDRATAAPKAEAQPVSPAPALPIRRLRRRSRRIAAQSTTAAGRAQARR